MENNGYFYERYRPGLGSVVVGIILVTMLVEVGISKLTSGQERAKIERLKMSARLVAWGPRYQALLAALLYSDNDDGKVALPNPRSLARKKSQSTNHRLPYPPNLPFPLLDQRRQSRLGRTRIPHPLHPPNPHRQRSTHRRLPRSRAGRLFARQVHRRMDKVRRGRRKT